MKFIADIMLGKLARYLRMAGYDVAYINDINDNKFIKIAINENRTALTRDSLMLARREFKNGTLKFLYIKDDKPLNQLKQVGSDLAVALKPNLVRCLKCNSLLLKVKKEFVRDKVPRFVYKTSQTFLFCKNCDKYYWRGTHYNKIENIFQKVNKE